MLFSSLFGSRPRPQDRDQQRRRNMAGAQETIDRHEDDKQRTLAEIAECRALATQKRPQLSEGARQWFDRDEADKINRLEQSIQWNDQQIVHARNIILLNSRP